jgi:hypothetical protein
MYISIGIQTMKTAIISFIKIPPFPKRSNKQNTNIVPMERIWSIL